MLTPLFENDTLEMKHMSATQAHTLEVTLESLSILLSSIIEVEFYYRALV
jgi:hypothetical protein